MQNKMKIMKLTGIRQMEMQQTAMPEIEEDNHVLIRVTHVGVCGSDMHYYETGRIGKQEVSYPFAVGHECSGVVEQTGSSVWRVNQGDRVAIDPAMPCWECDQCKAGRAHTCRNLRFLGLPGQAEGCLAEYIVMPQESCYPIPPEMSLEQAALSEPLSIGVYAVQQSIAMQGAKVGILGFGPIGLSVFLPAKAQGADKIYVTEKIPARMQKASELGAAGVWNPYRENAVESVARHEPQLLDVVFECCGKQEAIDNAVDLLKPGGKLMVIGIPQENRLSFSVDDMRHKELTIYNVRRQVDCVQPALDMIHEGRVNLSPMVTHRFGFGETKQAFDLVAGYQQGVMKAVICM